MNHQSHARLKSELSSLILEQFVTILVRELSDLIAERGAPLMIVSDNETELTSNAVLARSGDVGVEWHYIALASDAERVRRELQRAHVRQAAQ